MGFLSSGAERGMWLFWGMGWYTDLSQSYKLLGRKRSMTRDWRFLMRNVIKICGGKWCDGALAGFSGSFAVLLGGLLWGVAE